VPELLAAIIRNFITNALRFTPSGGTVSVTTARKGLFAIVIVRDNGPGIPTEHQDRIFDRFYRTETARDRVRGGSGLGLAIARRSSIDIGATIEVESELGSGSEFRLILPLNWT
jgi:signal transduction histidine kinase